MITRKLKSISFTYDESDKQFLLEKGELQMRINKVEIFALVRFIIRIAQRNWFRKHQKNPGQIKLL